MTLSISIKTFANNELRITEADLPSSRKVASDKSSDKRLERVARALSTFQKEIIKTQRGTYLVDSGMGECRRLSKEEIDSYEKHQSTQLDIIREFQRARNRYKSDSIESVNRPTKFTLNARRTILEAGAVLDSTLAHPGDASVVTLTVPGARQSALRAIASHSGYICNILLQQIRRHYPEALWFYCWELQKRGALHIHLCIAAGDREASFHAAQLIQASWEALLRRLEQRLQVGITQSDRGNYCYLPESWQNDVQVLRKSVAGYFGKYCSKSARGADPRAKGFGGVRVYSPKRWWGVSRRLLRMVKERRRVVRLEGFSRSVFPIVREYLRVFIVGLPAIVRHSFDFEVGVDGGRVNEVGKRNFGVGVKLGVGHTDVVYVKGGITDIIHQEIDVLVAALACLDSSLTASFTGCSNAVIKEALELKHFVDRKVNTSSQFTMGCVTV